MNLFRRILPLVVLLMVVSPGGAEAQNLQGWFNAIINWEKSERLVYELDFEPKGLLVASEGEADWRNLDITPNVEFSPNGWLDLIGETVTGYTRQTDDVNSFEVSPRVGVRFHFLSRGVPTAVRSKERPPARRIVIRDLVRVEFRNLFYTGEGEGTDSTVRFRNRIEFLVPLNREKMSQDGARYLMADWEVYIPLNDVEERFANKQRIRAGMGYRRSAAWRFEALYMWTKSRNTIEDGFRTSENIIDIRVKRIF